MKLNMTPILTQLTRSEGATIALAKMTLTKDQFEIYLIEQQIQSNHIWLDIFATFKHMFSETENFVEGIKKRIESLEKQRNEIIALQNYL